ncbi:MAG: hypothetical protein ACJAS6_000177 [Rickettsiales bacterium]|jgi:hypothetical protein
MKKFNTDFDYFWSLIDKNQNFTFVRYGDGEVMLMKGVLISESTQAFQVDMWKAPNALTNTGKDLLSTLSHTEDNYHYAIPSEKENVSACNYLKGAIPQKNNDFSFANLWINANYSQMKKKFNSLKRDAVVICNHRGKKENFPFNVIDLTAFPDDCINFWENNGNVFIVELIKKYQHLNDTLFFISCGPVSEIIIHRLYLSNPNNTYIDVGSATDEFVHQKITRPYADPKSVYYNMVSSFENAEKDRFSILKKLINLVSFGFFKRLTK